MREVTRVDAELLYGWFGIDAELLIDHAWGIEPTRMEDIKNYKTRSRSLTSGQVLMRDYDFRESEVIIAEMADALCLELVRTSLVCASVGISVGYSDGGWENASVQLPHATSADSVIVLTVRSLYNKVTDKKRPIRRLNVCFGNVGAEDGVQYSMFDDTAAMENNRKIQGTMIKIKEKYGLNSILKGINYDPSSTARERNEQIGGHKSGRKNASFDADLE